MTKLNNNSNNNQTWLVAKNTYRQRIKGFGYWALVLSPFLIAAIYLLIGFMISSGFNQRTDVAVVNQPALTQVLAADDNLNSDFKNIDSLSEAKSQLREGKIDGIIEQTEDGFSLTASNESNQSFSESDFQQAFNRIRMQQVAARLHLSAGDLQSLLSPANFKMHTLSDSGTEAGGDIHTGTNMAVSSVATIIIFFMLMIYVGQIAQEIGNEKSSRIMETLLATTSSNVQYYGKILGVLMLAVTQVAVYSLGFAIAYPFIRHFDAVKMVMNMMSGIDLSFGIYLALMTLVGIMGYILLASIVASLVNEQQQVQQAVQPITFLAMIGYIGGIAGASMPGNVFLKVMSFIPFISPTLMPGRYAIQFSTTREAYISLVLQLLATLVIAKLGEKIYARNVLSYSDEKLMKQFFKNLSSDRGKSPRGTNEVSNSASEQGFILTRKVNFLGKEMALWRVIVFFLVIILLILRWLVFR